MTDKAKSKNQLITELEQIRIQYNRLQKFEQELNDSEERYKNLLSNLPNYVIVHIKGKIVFINNLGVDTLGYPRDKILDSSILDYVDEPYRELAVKNLNRRTAGETVPDYELKICTQSGRKIDVLLRGAPTTYQNEQAFIVVLSDITERKKAEKALNESENTYRELFNFMNDAGYIQDENGLFLDVNQGAVQMYGYSREELIGKTPDMLSAEGRNDKEKTQAYIRKAFAGKSQNFDWWGKRKNGEIFPKDIMVNKGSYFGKDAVITIARDITERKNIEDQLKEYAAELKELNATKDKFFSIIAHDLKGPFNAILGFSDLLADNYDDFSEEEKKIFIQNIKIASVSTYKLLENLLDWSRLQTGKINPSPEMIDLSLLTLENISVLKSMADNKRIKLYSSIKYNTRAFADANMVRTILRNLMSNAINFTRTGGEVNISASTDNAMTRICVWDNGVGISVKRLGLLFRIDEKLSTKGTANETGTGLGLLLCKEMVEKQGGQIWVESEIGLGSRFFFTLPSEPN